MKIWTILSVLLVSGFLTSQARADFGEIDLMVRESIEIHFKESRRQVNLTTLEYRGQPLFQGQIITIQSSVWAEQRQIAPYWGWHGCVTQLKVKGRGIYEDLGTDCNFEL